MRAGHFDPQAYRVVLFDQRGAGRSTPPASDPAFRMTFARIVTHYFRHGGWLEEGQ